MKCDHKILTKIVYYVIHLIIILKLGSNVRKSNG